jgi:hypothetical protein
MRAWPLVFSSACAAAFAIACVSGPDDPPYGAPGSIGDRKFPGGGDTSSSGSTTGGDGGSSGTPGGPFPAAYNEATPPAPAELGPLHPTVAAGAKVTPTTACMACHGPQGTSTKKWAIGGWAAASAGSSNGLDKGEVIVVDGAKTLGPVKTSPDGYFWIEASAGTVGTSAHTSIRDKTGKVSSMQQSLGGIGDCNTSTCHGGLAGAIDFK